MASLWDDLGSLFEGVNWGRVATQAVPRLIDAGASTIANNRAARVARDAGNRNAELVQQYGENATGRFDTAAAASAPGVSYLRRVAATPQALTPLQQQELENVRRTTANTLNSSGMAGSGRAVSSALQRVNADAVNRFTDANLQRADNAARTLAGGYYQNNAGAAGVQTNVGAHVGAATERGMLPTADATTANARTTGSALGDISSFIASDVKGRRSKYAAPEKEEL